MRAVKLKSAVVAVILACVLTTTVFAVLLISKNIGTNISIPVKTDMIVLDVDMTTELTSIALGDFYRNDIKYFPSGLSEIPTTYYFIKNIGDNNLYFGFSDLLNPVVGITYTIYMRSESLFDNPENWEILTVGTIYSRAVNPTCGCYWYLKISISADATFGDYNPTIVFGGYDSATG